VSAQTPSVPADPRREDIAAYALGALPPAEAAELERHLQGCERCREYERWLRPALDLLPASVEQVRPSAGVREAIMAEVRADADAAAAGTRARRSRRQRQGWRGFVLRPAAALAAGLAVVAAGAGGYLLHGSGGASHSRVAAVPTSAAPSGSVSAWLDRVDGSATLAVSKMPPLPVDRVYEVWVQRGRQTSAQSTFILRRDGTANAAVPGPLDGASAVLVTEEPRGGSDQPTGAPLLRATLD
jgi:anti-sigma-K factor RskA